ncbi:hypothetical protein BGZ46_005179 [Entomortierella lignicola]|nr:hypothetical protein BGZ46_005179 [Entomortierella lignicola]
MKTKQNVALSISMWRDPSWVPSRNICLEVRKMIDSIAEETLEVKKLELSCSSLEDFTSDFSLLLAKCKKLERLRLECSDYATSEWLCRVMEESCPNLQHLNIVSPTFLDEDWASIVRSCRRLVTFKSNSCIEPLVVKALHKHSTTLEHIYLTGGNLGEGNLPLLSSCSKLKTFSCPYFVILPSAIIDMPEWTCLGLQTLSLNVRFDDRALHPNHTDEKESAQWIISTSQARHRLCEQIGKLSQLRKLEIRNRDWTMNTFDTNQAQEIKPIVALTPSGHDVSFIGLGNGLEMLANLKNLVDFVVEVGFEYFPRKNIEWMIEHWPKLRILHQFGMDVPSSAKEDPSFKEASKLYNGGDDYSGDLDWIKELRKQRPSLEFVVWGDGGRMWPPYKDTPACPTCTRS